MSLPFSLKASAAQGPIERAAERRLDPELCEPHPAPQGADLSDPDQKTCQEPLGLVADAVAPEEIGEIDGSVDVAGLQLQHLAQQQNGERALASLAQHRAALEQREHRILPLAALHLLVRDPLPVVDLLRKGL